MKTMNETQKPSAEIVEKLGQAKFAATQALPYMASVLHRVTYVESTNLPTLAVDSRWRLYYSADFVARQTVEVLAFGLLHEVGHLIREHHARGDEYGTALDHKLWNEVGDACINRVLAEAAAAASGDWIYVPDWALTHAKLGLPVGPLEEELYARLAQSSEDDQSDDGDSQSDDQNGQGGGSDDSGEGESESGTSGSSDGDEYHGCGSGAGNKAGDYEVPDSEAPVVQGVQAEAIMRKVAQDIMEHSAQNPGSVPGGFVAWAEHQMAPPTISWERAFAGVVRRQLSRKSAGFGKPTYARPAKRATMGGSMILPRRVRQELSAAIVLDTSGSMSPSELADSINEVHGIIRRARVSERNCAIFQVDANVASIVDAGQLMQQARSGKVEFAGGGGTDMRVGISAAEETGADVIVVLTDGFTPWPDSTPMAPLVIGLTGSENSQQSALAGCPEWAHVVHVGMNQ